MRNLWLIAAFLLGLGITLTPKAYALEGGLLDGKPGTLYNGGGGTSLLATDRNPSTAVTLACRTCGPQAIKWTFPSPKRIVKISFQKTSAIGITLRDSSGKILYSAPSGNGTYNIDVQGVTEVHAVHGTTSTQSLYEIDVWEYKDTEPPAIPTGIGTEAIEGGLNLYWLPNTEQDLAGYKVYENGTIRTTTANNSVSITDFTVGETRTYQVSAYDTSGNESGLSEPVTFKAVDKTPPAVPIGLVGTGTDRAVQLTWEKNTETDLEGYYVYLNGLKISPLPQSANNRQVNGLINNVNYRFSVSAVDRAGNESARSLEITVAPIDNVPPSAPRNFRGVPGHEKASLFWTANMEPDLDGYNLYQNGKKINGSPIRDVYRLVTGLINGVEYEFAITAVDQSGNESEATKTKVTPDITLDIDPPDKPVGLTGEAGERSVALSWASNAETDLVGYFVYQDGKKANYTPIAGTEFVIHNLSAGKKYTYQVTAIDQAGNESPPSEPVELTPIDTTPPEAPKGLTVVEGDGEVTLKWLPNTEEDLRGYTVYQDGVALNGIPTSATSFRVRNLTNGKVYSYMLVAVDQSGNVSAPTDAVTGRPRSLQTHPVNDATPDSLKVTWSAVEGAIGYDIYYNLKKVATVGPEVLEYIITKDGGYNPDALVQETKVIALLPDPEQQVKPPKESARWGFEAGDVFTASMWIIASLAGFVLFAIAMRYVPNLIKMIRESAKGG